MDEIVQYSKSTKELVFILIVLFIFGFPLYTGLIFYSVYMGGLLSFLVYFLVVASIFAELFLIVARVGKNKLESRGLSGKLFMRDNPIYDPRFFRVLFIISLGALLMSYLGPIKELLRMAAIVNFSLSLIVNLVLSKDFLFI